MYIRNYSKLLLVLTCFFLVSCASFNKNSHSSQKRAAISQEKEIHLYSFLKNKIQKEKATHLKECNCMKVLYRDLFDRPNHTIRYAFDRKIGEHAVNVTKGKSTVNVLVIGSGTLLNELTALSNIVARDKNINIYLLDWAYVFYGEKDYKSKAIDLYENKELIPEGWKEFYFWDSYKDKRKEYLEFFEKHHKAINEFKTIITDVAKHYGKEAEINVLKSPASDPLQLPNLDMIVSIDSFLDVPNLMWNLFYQLKLSDEKPVRFVALNKAKPLGGFWDSPDSSKREGYSLKSATIDVFDVVSTSSFGSFKLIEKIEYEANEEQLKNGLEFVNDPDRNSTQSPFDIEKIKNVSGV